MHLEKLTKQALLAKANGKRVKDQLNDLQVDGSIILLILDEITLNFTQVK